MDQHFLPRQEHSKSLSCFLDSKRNYRQGVHLSPFDLCGSLFENSGDIGRSESWDYWAGVDWNDDFKPYTSNWNNRA